MKRTLLLPLVLLLFGTTHAQLNVGLVGYWPLDSNAIDYSGNNNNGTVYGATPVPDRFGIQNHAYHFNGISDIIVVPNSPTVDMSNSDDFSLTFWVKPDPNNINSLCVTKNHYGTWSGYMVLANNQQNGGYCTAPGHLSFYVASGAWEDACSNNAVAPGGDKWAFVACVYKASVDSSYLYIDGVRQNDVGQSSGNHSTPDPLCFGGMYSCSCDYFNGALDGIRLYKRILSQSDINQLYAENPNGISPIAQDLDVSTYPNPTSGHLQFSYVSSQAGEAQVQVIDQLGNVVKETTQSTQPGRNEGTLELGDLANGVYYLRLLSGEISATQRITILK